MKLSKEAILDLLNTPGYVPLRKHELIKALQVKASRRAQFRALLRSMEEERLIVRLRKNRYAAFSDQPVVLGQLLVHAHGFGFVVPENGGDDIYIPADGIGNAMTGDTVSVSSTGGRRGAQGKLLPSGRIVSIIKRKRTTVVGLLMKMPGYTYLIPDPLDIHDNIPITGFADGIGPIAAHHKVVVKLDPLTPDTSTLSGTVIEDLGHEDEPGVDIISIVKSKGLMTSHRPETTQAVREITQLQNMNPDERTDLREELIFTIDPIDAKDFDDAISLQKLDDGTYKLGVHIADVAHYITPGDAIDIEAGLRGTSIYLVDRVIPMLPADLTTNICSLLPSEDRLTHSVEIMLDATGSVTSFRTFPSLIHSKARLNYQQVQAYLDQKDSTDIPEDVGAALTTMNDLAQHLRNTRIANGSINLNLPEIKCELDDRGHPVRIVKRIPMPAYQLIEEFMLLANQCVAASILKAEVPGIFRVHPGPDDDQWKRMAAELHTLGIPDNPNSRKTINRIAEKAVGTPQEYAVSLAILRNFKQAAYSADCDHHFGLAFEHYTHFTSPIRRYPDLVAHRIIKAIEKSAPPPYSHEELKDIARQTSETERAAMEAERESVNLKRIEYYAEIYRHGKRGPFKAIVASVTPIGLIIELLDTLQRGLIHFSSIDDDRYIVNDEKTQAVGRNSGVTYTIGMVFDVELIKVDERQQLVDFIIYTKKKKSIVRPRIKPLSGKKDRKKNAAPQPKRRKKRR